MPAAPKSPRSNKKNNTLAKPKGAVRAKSGCYTCRIRRKKCDEKRMGGHEDGPCETCLRLKLECLGFGAKRPEWLRETSRVSEIRDRIKAHLAAQGMIKGHAGSGSRSAVHDDILRLSDFRDIDIPYASGGSSSSASTPHRAESVESDSFRPHLPHPHLMLTPAIRGGYDPYPHIDHYPVHSDIPSRSHSPYDTLMSSVNDFAAADAVCSTHVDNIIQTPATRSSFSRNNLYNFDFVDPDDEVFYTIPPGLALPHFYPEQLIPQELKRDSLQHYVENVVKIQYLLGDGKLLPDMIRKSINQHEDSYEAVYLLSMAYHSRQERPQVPVLGDADVKGRVDSLKTSLSRKSGKQSRLSADDAMTALHVVSLFLFDGGSGDWSYFLRLAVKFVEFVLEDRCFFRNYPAALEAADPKVEFVVKTTIWFDVLASVTTQRPPLLLYYIRELFRPDLSWVGNPPTYTMMSPMGCENVVVWALAETSNLAYWKTLHERNGSLSVPELVRRAADIDLHLRQGPRPEPLPVSNEDWSRQLASEIFRTSTRLFLKTVESGDFTEVPEIKDAVDQTLIALEAISSLPRSLGASGNDYSSAILRSTVFGIFICGSLTNDPEKRQRLQTQLEQTPRMSEGVGNVQSVLDLLKKIWDMRPPYATKKELQKPIHWRRFLKDEGILLV